MTEEFLLLVSTTNDANMRNERREEDETEATKMFHYACEMSRVRAECMRNVCTICVHVYIYGSDAGGEGR